ncbi:MAG: HNH endonuclease [Burkholderiales bacterium]
MAKETIKDNDVSNRVTFEEVGWGRIFDEIKAKEGIESDLALAKTLSVSRAFISAIRKNRKNMPIEHMDTILYRLGRNLTPDEMKLFTPLRIQKNFLYECATWNAQLLNSLAIARANGHCELCGLEAPFVMPDGLPYLEIFRVTSVPTDKNHETANIVALCPNCHRKIELNPSETDLRILKEKVLENHKSEKIDIYNWKVATG